MNLAGNFDDEDLMKRTSQQVQVLETHSQMSTSSVRQRRITESGLPDLQKHL